MPNKFFIRMKPQSPQSRQQMLAGLLVFLFFLLACLFFYLNNISDADPALRKPPLPLGMTGPEK